MKAGEQAYLRTRFVCARSDCLPTASKASFHALKQHTAEWQPSFLHRLYDRWFGQQGRKS